MSLEPHYHAPGRLSLCSMRLLEAVIGITAFRSCEGATRRSALLALGNGHSWRMKVLYLVRAPQLNAAPRETIRSEMLPHWIKR
jgi:hypothetical protein